LAYHPNLTSPLLLRLQNFAYVRAAAGFAEHQRPEEHRRQEEGDLMTTHTSLVLGVS
jgi:hypothetical protein